MRVSDAIVVTVLFTLIGGTTYAVSLVDGLEGLWLFDEGSGDVARDSSGNGRDGELQGNPTWVKGVHGTALEFDGVDDNVLITGYTGVGGTTPRTVMLWWKSLDARDHSWVKWGIVQDTKKYYVRAHLAGAECYLRVETQGGQHYGSTNVCDGQWHHLAVVFPPDSNNVKDHILYVDGVPEANTAGNPVGVDTDVASQEVNIGAPLAHHTYARGVMDEVAIFARALSEEEINAIIDMGFTRALAVSPREKLTVSWGALKTSTVR